MTLFTDGPIGGLQELQRYENSILNVASTESIDLSAKLELAQAELGNQVLLFILRHAVRDTKAAVRMSVGLGDVVVTNPLKQWHALATLSMVYRDAITISSTIGISANGMNISSSRTAHRHSTFSSASESSPIRSSRLRVQCWCR